MLAKRFTIIKLLLVVEFVFIAVLVGKDFMSVIKSVEFTSNQSYELMIAEARTLPRGEVDAVDLKRKLIFCCVFCCD